ncbi:MAG TPA: LapA family protein [Methylomusa anaerophila]|uniref:LapA family protein n=1 Tax=Methylomusa anaerophila TaxID=1930071 RepID=UPI0022B2A7B3|nr:LapA family protein [Methylomusa anaerophila]HML87292.1 LapA family protein [Methylomusa anaerophila]
MSVFAVQNSFPVTVSFFAWSFQTSLVILILAAAIFGVLTVLSLVMPVQFRLQRRLHQSKQLQKDLEIENEKLRIQLAKELSKFTGNQTE